MRPSSRNDPSGAVRSNAPLRSRIYNDPLYVPWIENLAAHVALNPPRDSTITLSSSNRFPNTSNPYGQAYRHGANANEEFHPQMADPPGTAAFVTDLRNCAHYPDFLPLLWAVADEDIPMWDDAGIADSDGDGMPDDWELAHLLNVAANDAGDDPNLLPVVQHALARTYANWQAAGR